MGDQTDKIVDVVITRNTATPTMASFNEHLIVDAFDASILKDRFDANRRVKQYGSLSEIVDAGFPTDSYVHKAASVQFSQSPHIKSIFVGWKDKDETWTDALAAIKNQNNSWYALSVSARYLDGQKQVADWTQANEKLCILSTADANVLDRAETGDIGSYVKSKNLDRVAVLYHPNSVEEFKVEVVRHPETREAYSSDGKTYFKDISLTERDADAGKGSPKLKETETFDAGFTSDQKRYFRDEALTEEVEAPPATAKMKLDTHATGLVYGVAGGDAFYVDDTLTDEVELPETVNPSVSQTDFKRKKLYSVDNGSTFYESEELEGENATIPNGANPYQSQTGVVKFEQKVKLPVPNGEAIFFDTTGEGYGWENRTIEDVNTSLPKDALLWKHDDSEEETGSREEGENKKFYAYSKDGVEFYDYEGEDDTRITDENLSDEHKTLTVLGEERENVLSAVMVEDTSFVPVAENGIKRYEYTMEIGDVEVDEFEYTVSQYMYRIYSASYDVGRYEYTFYVEETRRVYLTSEEDEIPEAAWFGKMLTKQPGSATWALKSFQSVSVYDLGDGAVTACRGKNVNTYLSASGISITQEGKTGGEYIDVIHGLDWLKARIQNLVFGAMINVDKVPYTDTGIQMIVSPLKKALDEAVKYSILAEYSVEYPAVADIAATEKGERFLPDVKFYGTLAGAIHSTRIDGIITL